MELYLYTIPESCAAVLYISKLDSSGYGPKPISTSLREAVSVQVFGKQQGKKRFGNTLTATLSSAITQHFTTFKHWDAKGYPVSHLSVHILARSQRAYLFPSSPENKDKKVLSDGGLIKWWRAVMSDVIVSTRDPNSPVRKDDKGEIDARAYYLIPGYNKLESHPLVPLIRQEPTPTSASNSTNKPRTAQDILREAKWTYGHPYSSSGASCSPSDLPPLPLHWKNSNLILSRSKNADKVQQDPNQQGYDPSKVRTIPTLMPHFSDDAKTRFLDEIARDAHEHSGWKKKLCSSAAKDEKEGSKASAVTKQEKENRIQEKIDVSEFSSENDTSNQANRVEREKAKKRRSEDQEPKQEKKSKLNPSNTNTTNTSGSSLSGVPLITIRAQMREREAMDDLAIDEFWERMGFRQECCSGNAVGVFVILFTRIPPSSSSSPSVNTGLERQPLSLPYKVLGDLVFKSLIKDTCQWNKVTHARTLTQSWLQAVDKEVRRKGGLQQYLEENGAEEKEGGLVGEGIIWKDFTLRGPTKEQLEKAQEGKKDANQDKATGGGVAVGGNVLNVKRNKKLQA